MKRLKKFVMIVLMMTCVSAMADDVIVIIKNGRRKHYPSNGRMQLLDRKGTIKFVDARDGQPYTYKRNQLFAVITPMPQDVLKFENLFRSMKYDKVIELSAKIHPYYMWTGWGSYVEFIKAMAEMNLKKYDDASTTLRKALAYEPVDRREALLKFGLQVVNYAQNGGNIIEKPSVAAMLLNGLALEKKKDLRSAALEYMKAKELYPPADKEGVPDLLRMTAMSRLVSVLREAKDSGMATKMAADLARGN